MTNYTSLGGDWGTAADWDDDVIPNSPDADVFMGGTPSEIAVTLAAGQSYSIRSLFVTEATLTLGGLLSVSQTVEVGPGALEMSGGVLTAGEITIDLGALTGWGTIDGDVVNDREVLAGVHGQSSYGDQLVADDLVINGDVSGIGSLHIAGQNQTGEGAYYYVVGGEIELNGASSNDVVFDDGVGTLRLDKPNAFTGTISVASVLPSGNGFGGSQTSFDLTFEGVSYSSVTNYVYSGDLSGGVLTIDTTAGNYAYKFSGAFQTSDFSLSSDGGSGLVVQVTPTPIISGTVAGQKITNTQTAHPFADIVISDSASGQYNDDATVKFSGGDGAWSNLGAGVLGEDDVYYVNGDPTSIAEALRALVFTPTPGDVTVGATQTFTFTVTYSDYAQPTVTDSSTTVLVTATTTNISQSGVTLHASDELVSFVAPANYDTVVGDDDTILAPKSMTLTVDGIRDAVYLSDGRLDLTPGANVSVVGDGDTAILANGATVGFYGIGDVAQVSDGTVYLGGAANVVIVGDADVANAGVAGAVMGFYGTGDLAEISQGTVYLGAESNVTIAGDGDVANTGAAGVTMGFVGIGDIAEISHGTVYLGAASNVVIVGSDDVANTAAAGDVMGFIGLGDTAEISNGTVYLGGTTSVVIEGDDDVANTAAAGDVMTFVGKNDVAEITDGAVVLGASTSVTIIGKDDLVRSELFGDTMNFTGARDTAEISNGTVGLQNASVAIVGANDKISLGALFGLDTLSGFGASDLLQFRRQDFASAGAVLAAATQSGSDTLITLDANDSLRLAGVNLSNLMASQIQVV